MKMFRFAVALSALILTGSASRADWNYNRNAGTYFANPSTSAFNLGSPGPGFYPTDNYSYGGYVPSYGYPATYAPPAVSSAYSPSYGYGGYYVPTSTPFYSPDYNSGGLYASSYGSYATSSYATGGYSAPGVSSDAAPRFGYAYGGYANPTAGNRGLALNYPYAFPSTRSVAPARPATDARVNLYYP